MSKGLILPSIKTSTQKSGASLSAKRVRSDGSRSKSEKAVHDFKSSLQAQGHNNPSGFGVQDKIFHGRDKAIKHKSLRVLSSVENKSTHTHEKAGGRHKAKTGAKVSGRAGDESTDMQSALTGGPLGKHSSVRVKNASHNKSTPRETLAKKVSGFGLPDSNTGEAVSLKSAALTPPKKSSERSFKNKNNAKARLKAVAALKGAETDTTSEVKRASKKHLKKGPAGIKALFADKEKGKAVKGGGTAGLQVEENKENFPKIPMKDTSVSVEKNTSRRSSLSGGYKVLESAVPVGTLSLNKKPYSNKKIKAGLRIKKNTARPRKRGASSGHNKVALEKKGVISGNTLLKSGYAIQGKAAGADGSMNVKGSMSFNVSVAVNLLNESGAGTLTGDAGGGLGSELSAGTAVNAAISGGNTSQVSGSTISGTASLHSDLTGTAQRTQLIKQTAKGVVMSLSQRDKEIVIELKPENLGRMRIKVRIEDGLVETSILVDNPRVMNMLTADALSLKELLSREGFMAGGLEVALNNNGNAFGAAEEFSGNKEGASGYGTRGRGSAKAGFTRQSEAEAHIAGVMENKLIGRGLDLFI